MINGLYYDIKSNIEFIKILWQTNVNNNTFIFILNSSIE